MLLNCITKLSKAIKQTIMQNKLLKITIYLIGFIVIFILMLMISSFAINWLVNTPNPFGLGFIDESNKDTWINFFGAIIGGIATLAGVCLTIREERKNSLEQQKRLELQRREDLAIQYKPFLCTKIVDKDHNFESTIKVDNDSTFQGIYAINIFDSINNDYSHIYKYDVEITNLGDGECFLECMDTVTLVKAYRREDYLNLLTHNHPSCIKKDWNTIIARKKSITLRILILYKDNSENQNNTFSIVFPFQYCDQFNYKKYEASLSLNFKVNNNDNKTDINLASYVILNDEIKP